VLRVIAELAAPRALAELRERTVELVAGLVSCTVASWNEIDMTTGRFDLVAYPRLTIDAELPMQRMLALLDQHPVITHVRATGDGRPLAISDFIDEAAFRETELYREVYSSIDTLDQLSMTLPDPHRLIGVALNRSRPGFTKAERRALNLLRPHLVHAHRNALAFERMNRALQALEHRAAASGESLIVLSGDGRVEYLSPGTDELLSEWFHAGVDARATLPAALSGALPPVTLDRPPAQLVLARDGQVLTVERLDLPAADGHALLMSRTASVPMRLRDLGLSPRQTEVVMLAAEGLRDAAIAVRLGISRRTVEKHLQVAYRQLGAQGRVAAVQLVHRIAAPPSLTSTTRGSR
jgi:DNA-binding CsgD family transcriptional regulator